MVFAALCELVEMGWFKEVHINFLPPGHTHSNIDQKYSVISQKLKKKDLLLVEHVMEEVSELFSKCGPLTGNFIVPVTADFDEYFKDRTFKLSGHGTAYVEGQNRRLHSFKIVKTEEGTVGMLYKEYDEATDYKGIWDSMDKDGRWRPVEVVKFDKTRRRIGMSEKLKASCWLGKLFGCGSLSVNCMGVSLPIE